GLSTYEKLLLVPNYRKTDESGATDLHLYLLGITREENFWSRLASVVRWAKIYEEYGNGCVSAVEMNLNAYGVHVVRDSNTIFDYPQELLEK
ncbi:MAG: hypothetical protein NTY06_02020, partial [Candidatus Gottesmanbacteria bacterium]|nr:hypothetical protein [Candidatus Gottesmanbacteria bacterium]